MNAIIGASGSGKSSLGIYLAKKFKLNIFSIDSLSIYKYIDIASAKPSKDDLKQIKHYGIDLLNPDEKCSAKLFFDLLKQTPQDRLLIVGGSSFYLKSIMDGLSPMPKSPNLIDLKLDSIVRNKQEAHKLLSKIDSNYASKINPNDKYRIKKALEIYFLTNKSPSEFFKQNKKEKLQTKINIFELIKPKETLKSDIKIRVDSMLKNGIIDEVNFLKKNFKNSLTFRAIGIKETLLYLENKLSLDELKEQITKNTIALAKRQTTFNRTQFSNVTRGNATELINILEKYYENN
ncbi:tRNA (adenosine(37)-N6)-dimethylallyltransferase MiaA [Helicobacter sp. MIT 14-3879]|uniref:tRNA (adenosine(37)-N6)-dimethylallyltransferase MiaA n=1 Tax=Helicobacter sp. MIT 14-3879 TaxID=2040649 RepID=UPI000E1EFDC4|nr:tRNA (adenosine(37)-N6)-dimethylallyltransferase MiaA [Helicobacter sp. MIT 14-3879]RDU65030.1 tRNA (adenosine(37)-N6)-dimethylallyltransferase MiaA [Helicobacter sp. MIT 14-3879]